MDRINQIDHFMMLSLRVFLQIFKQSGFCLHVDAFPFVQLAFMCRNAESKCPEMLVFLINCLNRLINMNCCTHGVPV